MNSNLYKNNVIIVVIILCFFSIGSTNLVIMMNMISSFVNSDIINLQYFCVNETIFTKKALVYNFPCFKCNQLIF